MLVVNIPETEGYDSRKNLFYNVKSQTISFEHSLVSISKWESKWHKPFLEKSEKTEEETIDYIKCMTITPNVSDDVYVIISRSSSILKQIKDYIDDPMTATTFSNINGPPNREIITSEIIYYWMTALNIPFECQKWHLNRLLTLIKVCNIKNSPSKKMPQKEAMSRQRSLNAARRRAHHSRG
jgi:hypothetical protein